MVVSTSLPSGTVTLLFTDVEGSTRLWEAEPDAMAAALRAHDSVLRSAIEGCGGYVFKTVGDAFCASFSTPQTALAAAVAAQEALVSQSWPTSRPIRVRMALHTGVCEEREGDYFGPVVNRAARLEAAAHGGQVLVSGATAELLEETALRTVRLKNLGLHRLKDLERAEHVFEVETDSLPGGFPPLRSLDNPELSNNLPSLLSPFVGRERELAEIRSLLDESRLVTLTGAGGSGKTRLALQVAADLVGGLGEGVWLVELGSVTDPGQVPAAVATTLGVSEQGERPIFDILLEALSDQRLLIVLDNCEHLVEACAGFVDDVSRRCPEVRLLVTSREPLGVRGELVYRVPSLSLPEAGAESVEELEGSDAVSLFVQRAKAQDSAFALDASVAGLVASICRRLDGIPLALELAAARLSTMSLVHLHDRLDQRFRLLTGGSRNALPRQQTLQAMVDWSFGLLNEPEQTLLRRLSVFAGGFELEAAEAVGAGADIDVFDVADLLGSLVDKSLVIAERSSSALRYRLLETIADYAAQEMLRSEGETALLEARDRHAAFYLSLAETAGGHLSGPDQGTWLRKLDGEWDNLRGALVHLSANKDETESVLRLGTALGRFFMSRGHFEALPYFHQAVERSDGLPADVVAEAIITLVVVDGVLRGSTDPAARRRLADLARRAHELSLQTHDPALRAWGLAVMAGAAYLDRHDQLARDQQREALAIARASGDDDLMGLMLMNLASYLRPDSLEESQRLHTEALEHLRRAGDVLLVSVELHDLGGVYFLQDRPLEARGYLEEATRLAAELGAEQFLFLFRSDLGSVLIACGEIDEAAALVRGNLVTARRLGLRPHLCGSLFTAACCATWQGDFVRAARLHGCADAVIAADVEARSFNWTPLEDRIREEARAYLAENMTEEARALEYGRGATLSMAQAVDLALGRTNPD